MSLFTHIFPKNDVNLNLVQPEREESPQNLHLQTSKVETGFFSNNLRLAGSSAAERLTATFTPKIWSHFAPASEKCNVRNSRLFFLSFFDMYVCCRMLQKLSALSWRLLAGAADGASPQHSTLELNERRV